MLDALSVFENSYLVNLKTDYLQLSSHFRRLIFSNLLGSSEEIRQSQKKLMCKAAEQKVAEVILKSKVEVK